MSTFVQPTSILVQDTLGALSIGTLVSLFLFGAVTLQVYIYLIHFRNDDPKLKTLVSFVWICELAHCISVAHLLYYFTISRYGDLSVLIHPPKSLPLSVLLAGLEAWVIKIFFADRVRILSGGRLLIPLVCWVLVSVSFAMSIVTAIKVIQLSTLTAFQDQWNWLATALLCIQAGVDVIVASSLCYYLSISKKELKASSTITIIRGLMTWAIGTIQETGVVTSIGSLSLAVCFVKMPRNFIWLAIFACIPRTLSNALLLSLNSRIKSQPSDGLVKLDALHRGAKGHGYHSHRASLSYNSDTAAITSETVLSIKNSVPV